MPGPANFKKKAKSQSKKGKQRSSTGQPSGTSPTRPTELTQQQHVVEDKNSQENHGIGARDPPDIIPNFKDASAYHPDIPLSYPTPLVQRIEESIPYETRSTISIPTGSPLIPPTKGLTKAVERALFQEPFIQDPGNGPRVRDTKAFMRSFFAQPPAWDDPLCAEFAQGEILQMLRTVLPEDMALVLWYNKSRSQSRICPACQRLYNVMDILKSHVDDTSDNELTPQLVRERLISGLCSPMCFILACFDFPSAIKSAWGATSEELDDLTWEILNHPSLSTKSNSAQTTSTNGTSRTLGLLVRMTRMHDLGLAQLCFEPEDMEQLCEEQGGRELFEGRRSSGMSSRVDTQICA